MKHTEIAKAWLDGADVQIKIQGRWTDLENVADSVCCPDFDNFLEYRHKPHDQVIYAHIEQHTRFSARVFSTSEHNWSAGPGPSYTKPVNAKLTFDGETGDLKAMEFLK